MNQKIAGIFKAYDVRGKVGSELNPTVVEKIGQAFADWLPTEGAVAVGHDMREDSAELTVAFIKGIAAQGRDVVDIGQVTTEMSYFAAAHLDLAGGAVITASHNPGKDNGIKFCGRQARAVSIDSGLVEIRDMVLADKFEPAAKKGSITKRDVTDAWIEHTLSFIDVSKLKPLKIAVDAGNGMAGKIFPALEPHVPFQVTEMYFELDGSFPNHEANPMKPETLNDIIKTIKAKGLDAGVAFDADGDRALLIDELGGIVTGPMLSLILVDYFLQTNPGATIVYDVRNSQSVPELIKELGGKPIISPVGHSLIKDRMFKHQAVFGAEASGHFYFKDCWYVDSGLIATLISLYVLSVSGLKLSELSQKYGKYYMLAETNYEVEDKIAAIELLAKKFAAYPQNRLDGLTVNFPNHSWFNVRPSNTESLLRLNVEAKSKTKADKLAAEVKAVMGVS